jgi:hypothetical protein
MIRRKRRRSTVSRELAAAVFTRDGYACVAPRLGGSSMDCFGRNRIEHVQDGYGRMGVRAESDMAHLTTLCAGHTEEGMRAGYVWATDHRNREAMRAYLRSFDPPDPLQLDATG